MERRPGTSGRAGTALAQERLAQYRRLAGLIERQEEALDLDDLDRFERLGSEIATLQQEIGPASLEVPSGPPSDLDRACAAVLREAIGRSQRLRNRIDGMRRDGARKVRTAKARAPQARRYVAGDGLGRNESPHRLDVTS